ncbi:MAG: hypothetical protein EOP47_26580 [Sphingobacteriaceae bacterium]|nr:MAG: hypothetical protein EOP47_26580 [Sphingobacteriaceae bacterium]
MISVKLITSRYSIPVPILKNEAIDDRTSNISLSGSIQPAPNKNIFISTTPIFTGLDVGKRLLVVGAYNNPVTEFGITISAYTSPTQVTLSTAADNAVINTFAILGNSTATPQQKLGYYIENSSGCVDFWYVSNFVTAEGQVTSSTISSYVAKDAHTFVKQQESLVPQDLNKNPGGGNQGQLYTQNGFLSTVSASEYSTNHARPGYGFLVPGTWGTSLYAEYDLDLRLLANSGATATILTTFNTGLESDSAIATACTTANFTTSNPRTVTPSGGKTFRKGSKVATSGYLYIAIEDNYVARVLLS